MPKVVVFTGLPGTGKSTLAARAADLLEAPVFGWDWIMAALSPFREIQLALRAMGGPAHASVGWSLMWNLTVAQLRLDRSVILDAVAREEQAQRTRALAAEYGAECLVVLTTCRDEAMHRSRVEGRSRDIPGWHELDWSHVLGVKERFVAPSTIDLVLDAGEPLEANQEELARLLTPDSPIAGA